MAASEDALIDNAIHGDRGALATLLEQYGPSVRRGLVGEIPPRWRSLLSEDDVMQQTYADAVRDIHKFKSQGVDAFPRWLATLMNNNLRDAIEGLEADRRGGKARRIEPKTGDQSYITLIDILTASTSTPSRCVSREENAVYLKRAIGQLPEAYAHVVRLYDLEGRPISDVAATLGRSPGAVFMLRARAHSRLQELMGPASAYFSTI
ncbi:MAG TPA: RNA polymerase sigma factor [Phycisphaerae bacterium]|nr:RNA polymerase sigma factor [Phycisphaerae bacterium]HRY71450.1 RNA polymerase sigma factor [Phycisphaerae bacterium]HSA29999.1 RNA polymerase sigma factor [Phycisphaerae bacterium]